MVFNFKYPVNFESMFLKQHRSPFYYLKTAHMMKFEVKAYLENHLVLDTLIYATNTEWHHYLPLENIIIDRLEIPANMDIDNLKVSILTD